MSYMSYFCIKLSKTTAVSRPEARSSDIESLANRLHCGLLCDMLGAVTFWVTLSRHCPTSQLPASKTRQGTVLLLGGERPHQDCPRFRASWPCATKPVTITLPPSPDQRPEGRHVGLTCASALGKLCPVRCIKRSGYSFVYGSTLRPT